MPARLGSAVLRALTCIVDAVPRADAKPSTASPSLHLATCRFLLGLSMLDVFGWMCYKIVQFEAILQVQVAADMAANGRLPDPIFTSQILFVTVLTTLETTIEIVTSALVPTVMALVEHTHEPSPGTLAIFVCKVYTFSALCAFALAIGLSPCILGGAVDAVGQSFDECGAASCGCRRAFGDAASAHTAPCSLSWMASNASTAACCLLNGTTEVQMCATATAIGTSACSLSPDWLAVVFAAAYCLLYCFLNQLGDAAREMAQTQWLGAFAGTDLVVPGFASGLRGRAINLVTSRRAASASGLSTHLLLLRFFVSGVGGVIYIGVRTRPSLRLGLQLVASALGSVSGMGMLCSCGGGTATKACDEAAEGFRGGRSALSMTTVLRHHWPRPDGREHARKEAAHEATASDGAAEAGSVVVAFPPLDVDADPHRTAPSGLGSWTPAPREDDDGNSSLAVAMQQQQPASPSSSLKKEAPGEDQLVLWPWQLHRWEVSLALFMVASRGLPTTNSDTILAYVSSSTTISHSLAVAIDGGTEASAQLTESLLAPVGAVLWLVTLGFLVRKARWLPETRTKEAGKEKEEEDAGKSHPTSTTGSSGGAGSSDGPGTVAHRSSSYSFSSWLGMLWGLLSIMIGSGLLLAVPAALSRGGGGGLTTSPTVDAVLGLLAILLYVPYLPVVKLLEQVVDSFLMEHDERRAPSIVYWSNVLLALVVWPLLLLKWVVVTTTTTTASDDAPVTTARMGCGAGREVDAQRESFELGLVVMLTCALLAAGALYYTFVDPWAGELNSLRAALRRHARA